MSGGSAQRGGRVTRSLVTGGAGFIGSHLVGLLLARGDDVTVLDDLSTGRRENLAEADPEGRSRVIIGDLRVTLPTLRSDDFDEVYHLAAAVGVDLVMQRPIESIEANVELTSLILRFAASLPLEGRGRLPTEPDETAKRPAVLIASSSEVYGRPTRQVFSEDDDVAYGPTTVRRWSYAYAKAIDEHLAQAFGAQVGLAVVCVRLFNTVGPRQIGRYGMVMPRFVSAAMRGEPIRVFGDGRQSRCFCDVRDVAGAMPGLIASPAARGRVLNLGSDAPTTINELAATVIAQTGSSSRIVHVPYDEAYPAGYEDLQHRRPDLRRVRDAIGFEPRVPLRQTIADLAAWIRDGGDTMPPEVAASGGGERGGGA